MKRSALSLRARSLRNLASAKRILDDGDYDIAISRSNYAMFYAAQAALNLKGKTYAHHSGVLQGFWEQFVKTGVLRRPLHDMFVDAFEERNESDYNEDVAKTREEAERVIAHAEEFLHAVTPLLT